MLLKVLPAYSKFLQLVRCRLKYISGCEVKVRENFLREECQDPSSGKTVQRCPFSETVYQSEMKLTGELFHGIVLMQSSGYLYDNQCLDDIIGYQACGPQKFGEHNSEFICDMFVCSTINGKIESGPDINKLLCNGVNDCKSGIDEKVECSDIMYICPEQYTIEPDKHCDDRCDCDYSCQDELECSQNNFGFICSDSDKILSPNFICNGYEDCMNGEDELECSEDTNRFCITINNTRMLLSDSTRCFAWAFCNNFHDQTNCSDDTLISLYCPVDGWITGIADRVICKAVYSTGNSVPLGIELCDDHLDSECYAASSTCYIHKHQLCDQSKDCWDGSDESSTICRDLTGTECIRRYGFHNDEINFPKAWINDGVADCVDLKDEDATYWTTCEYNRSDIVIYHDKSEDSTCEDVFVCSPYSRTWRSFKTLCNNTDPCTTERNLCAPKEKLKMDKAVVVNSRFRLSYCLPGLTSISDATGVTCTDTEFPSTEIYGATTNLITVPNVTHNCSYFYGESYVFLSCLNLCKNATCPIKGQANLKSASCQSDISRRMYTITKNNKLVFVRGLSDAGFTIRNVFQCANHKCIGYDQVCNLENDCGDGSDENSCKNHFMCNKDNTHIRRYIPLSRRCNGVHDCLDHSDEFDCGGAEEIITSIMLTCSAWIIGLLAAGLNFSALVKNIPSIVRIRSSAALMDKVLILMISLGDMMVGWYLVAIAAVDIYYKKVSMTFFADEKFFWMTSSYCSSLGITSTIGSQLSLVAMATLSITRVIGITSALSMPKPLNTKYVVKVCFTTLLLVLLCVVISVIPVLPALEDSFANALNYLKVYFVKDFTDKEQMKKMAEVYYGRMKWHPEEISLTTYSRLIEGMFTSSYQQKEIVEKRTLKFYGNDPVCLFKFFVSQDDPQLPYSWGVLGFNFFCFVIITVSYLIVNVSSLRSSAQLSQGASADMLRNRNRKLQRKVSIIIATDFMCWMPFILIALLHTTGIYDAVDVYGWLSIIILPINSVINPLLYDDILSNIFLKVREVLTGKEKNVAKVLKKCKDSRTMPQNSTAFQNNATGIGFANTARRVSHDIVEMRRLRKSPSILGPSENAALATNELGTEIEKT